MTTTLRPTRATSAQRAGWVPKQHGAWAMLITPWLLGAALRARSGQPEWVAEIALLAFWLAAYLVFQAASTWLKAAPVRRGSYVAPVLTYGGVAAALGVFTWWLLGVRAAWWVPAFVPLLAYAWWLAWRRRERSLAGGVVTVAAAALMGLVARYLVPQVPDAEAVAVVLACFAYFTGTVLYVKTMIRERGRPVWLWASVGFHAAATLGFVVAWLVGGPRCLPWVALVLAGCTVRALAVPWFGRRRVVTPQAIGLAEVAVTLALVLACLLP